MIVAGEHPMPLPLSPP